MQKRQVNPSKANYQILLLGKIPTFREQWFDGMSIHYDGDGNSLLCGAVMDQAALHGVLEKIRDLGLVLISVTQMESE